MKTYYRTYDRVDMLTEERSIVFGIVTDGKKTQISFRPGMNEYDVEGYRRAIGARLEALSAENKNPTAIEVLDAIPYNTMLDGSEFLEEEDAYDSFDAAWEQLKEELFDLDEEEPKLYEPLFEYPEAVTAAAGECPPATQDIALNLKNRKNAIDTAMYGPLNPEEPNDEYWQALATEWNVDTETAKKQRCGNCAVFVVTTDMKNCISQGLTGETQSDEFDAIDAAGELGYCEAFDFKCASARTCRAWVAGGPVDDNKVKEQ
jgi:hypothetical protein